MLRKFLQVSVLVFAATGLATPAASEEAVALKGSVMIERIVMDNGQARTVLSPPEGVVPGDRLLFSTSYENGGEQAVDNFVVTNPLPKAVRLAEIDPAFVVSVDGGTLFGEIDTLTIEEEGSGVREANMDDVTHIRWTVERVEPGVRGELSYYGIVR